ncbi:cbb3-type cytochrome oxidase assembly protein CcoS [Azonexus sp.]|uniref:cbb3-type cytochrome oxidase assembly protein CcoS n=1 Tax=Azonexus sp. TaxID=1872668 RepID=UPI0039E3F5B6
MESVYLLIPVSVVLVFGIAAAFWWSVKSGQFDDLEGPAFKVLMDDDDAAQGRLADQQVAPPAPGPAENRDPQ